MANRLARTAGEGLLVAVLGVPPPTRRPPWPAAGSAWRRLGLLVRTDSWLGLAAYEVAAADAQAAGIATLLDRAGWRTAMLSEPNPG